jgi:hypothetical protein
MYTPTCKTANARKQYSNYLYVGRVSRLLYSRIRNELWCNVILQVNPDILQVKNKIIIS